MPFKSKAQRRWMYANNPELAKEFEKETGNPDALPNRIHPRTARRRRISQRRARRLARRNNRR